MLLLKKSLFLAQAIFSLLTLTLAGSSIPSSAAACQKLKQLYPDQIFLPSSAGYVADVAENWSETCVLPAYCVFEPNNASDVAGALAILTTTNTKFTVRGGGHMPVPGAASISDGVLISMERMNRMTLTDNKTIAQLEPGLRWGAVYDWISKYDLGVTGGRYSPVGVPGLLLGGGIPFFGSQYGWSVSRVANFEVVLANSSIVQANQDTNPDLFWALKGGSSNFGIVTRFDCRTFPLNSVYGGTTTYKSESLNDYLDAIASYVVPGGGSDDVRASINPTLQLNVSSGTFTINSLSTHVGSDPNPAAFANFSKIPASSSDNSVRTSFATITDESAIYGDRSSRWLFTATALKGTAESVYLSNRNFFETIASMPALKNVPGLLLASGQQTITKSWLTAARAAGGDAIDLDPANGNFIAYLISAHWDNPADDQVVNEFARTCIANLDAAAKSAGLYYPFVYLNDATGSADVFAHYGGGKSLPRLRAIAKSYDPKEVFQTLMPGGFKISSQ